MIYAWIIFFKWLNLFTLYETNHAKTHILIYLRKSFKKMGKYLINFIYEVEIIMCCYKNMTKISSKECVSKRIARLFGDFTE